MNIAEKIVEALLETGERIVAAAIRFPDGEVFDDITHYGAVVNAYNAGRFGDIPYEHLEDTYVDREEAAEIAIAANQASQGSSARSHGSLDSEDIHMGESVAVDLDGTLAKDSGWKGPEHIGEPVKPMLDLVRKLLDDGEEVVIFTARVHDGEKSTKEHIRAWLRDHDLPDLEITNEKRPDMEKFYDDKAIAVKKNTGDLKSGA